MAISVADNKGRTFHLSGEAEKLVQGLIDKNAELRAALLAQILEFENKRLQLVADALAGRPTPGYADGYTTPLIKRQAALRAIL